MEPRILANRYELLENVGNGGMAEVYKAHDQLLDRIVAVKILHAQLAHDEEFLSKFHSEAKGVGKLSHANIVNIYDVGEDNNAHFIVMEFVAGDNLKKYIKNSGKLEAIEVLKISLDIASALEVAHKHNLIHCDVKPHNILVMNDGHVKVADFGIARAVTASTMIYNNTVVGSVHYFSPEQAKGISITPKSDIYSLGVCMYEMLSGKLPFEGETSVSIALKHLQEDAAPLRQIDSNIPPVVEAIVQKAMAKNPEERPSSTEIIADLKSALDLITYKNSGAQAEDPFATQLLPRITPKMAAANSDNHVVNPKAEPYTAEEKPFYKSKKFILSLIMIIIVGFGIGVFLSVGKFWTTAEVEVPDVVGRQTMLAQQMLEDKDLRVTLAETYDANIPEGQVVSQYPEAGAKVKVQRAITIYISKGGEEMIMPDLRGMSKENAKLKLDSMGLKAAFYEENNTAEAGTVIAQEIKAGGKIAQGKTIDITISKGEKIKKINIPDYSGMSVESARLNIEANGLVVGKITQKKSNKTAGTVLSQDPAAGTSIKEGTSVDLVVSQSITNNSKDAYSKTIKKNDKNVDSNVGSQQVNKTTEDDNQSTTTSTEIPTVGSNKGKGQ